MARSSIPSQWPWALAGAALGLAAAVLLFAPAQWLAGALVRASGGHVLLHDARGTVWNGSAQLLLAGGQGSSAAIALPSRLDWQLRPAWGGADLALSSACCTPQAMALQVRARWGGLALQVADARSQWPAALLAGLGTPWNTLQIEGDLQLATQGLSVEWIEGRTRIAGRAELQAQRLSSRLSTLRPMGSYSITLVGGASPTLQLGTLEGSLRLSGSGQWVGSRLRFNGEASAAPEHEAALANLLNIIGRRNGARSLITIG
ncbi:type II secretion system protein N [uncultured Ramlibacter sp.]|uniref:type II secretion system protein N n=1 Tax=uncultured Ramlibacter sp. TaxID=260755 RepID=UPI00261D2494|nr:type II secretion system protein N [uncultured Ramlibacter sp.]